MKADLHIDLKAADAAVRLSPARVRSATVKAVNVTGMSAMKAEVEEMARVFDRPTPYTLNSVGLTRATADTMAASLFVKDDGEGGVRAGAIAPNKYIWPEVHGGERRFKRFEKALQRIGVMRPDEAAVPGAYAKLDQYGNMAASQITQLLSYLQAFGEQGYRANATAQGKQRIAKGSRKKGVRGVEYFVNRGKGTWFGGGSWKAGEKTQHLKQRGVYARVGFGFGKALKPVLMFVRKPVYQPRFDFEGVAQRRVDERFPRAFAEAWGESASVEGGK
jgi:hypothetical protein